jgi:hypothetical protein
MYEKIESLIAEKKRSSEEIDFGFIERHASTAEVVMAPVDLCKLYFSIDARHLYFRSQGDNVLLCIEDYGKLDVSKYCIDLLSKVKDEFYDDIIDDSTSSWSLLIFDRENKFVYELKLISVEILSNEKEAIIKCKNCRKHYINDANWI